MWHSLWLIVSKIHWGYVFHAHLEKNYWTRKRSSISDVIIGGNRQKRKNSFSSPLPYLVRKLSLSSPLGAPSTSSQKAIQLKFGVIGPPKSGKTALLVRFLTGRFINNYISGKSNVFWSKILLIYYRPVFCSNTTRCPYEKVENCSENFVISLINSQ